MPNKNDFNLMETIFDMHEKITRLVVQNEMMLHIQEQHSQKISTLEKWKSRTAAIGAASGLIGGFLGYIKMTWLQM